MTVRELSSKQLIQLKRYYLNSYMHLREGRKATEEELDNADALVTDEQVFKMYNGIDFSNKDFEYVGI